MAIHIRETSLLFHLQSKETSYIFQIVDGYPAHLYWGRKLRHDSYLEQLPSTPNTTNLDRIPQEYPQYGSGDFRMPAYQAQLEDGSRITELVYRSYRR